MSREIFLTGKLVAGLGILAGVSVYDARDDQAKDIEAYWDMAVCVDPAGRRVADEQCSDDRHAGAPVWYYLRRGSRVPYYGDPINSSALGQQASLEPDKGITYDRAPASTKMTRSEAVARGGLGSSAHRMGAGRS